MRSLSDGPADASLRGQNSPFHGILPEIRNTVFSDFHQTKRKCREKTEPGEREHKLCVLEQEQAHDSAHVSLPSPARAPKPFHSWDVNHSEVDYIHLLKGKKSVSQLCFHSFDSTFFRFLTLHREAKGPGGADSGCLRATKHLQPNRDPRCLHCCVVQG